MRASLLVALTAVAAVSMADPPSAQAMVRRPIHLPAQDLESALQSFIRDRELQIVFRSSIVKRFKTEAIDGEYSAEEVLERLLHGTGLIYRFLDEKTVTITRPVDTGSAPALPVSGSHLASATAQSAEDVPATPSADVGPSVSSGGGVAPPEELQQVLVTGSRIARSGFEAPTPVTVIGEEQIHAAGRENLADFVNELPALVGSSTPQNSNLSFSNGQAGINALNLRSLGPVRTLVLIDGQRSVGSAITGVVDINDVPQALVQRVEIVTGGASAAYGSDAVGGVVNFILDKNFTGFKSEISGGETTYWDDPTYQVRLTGGLPFADGRGHLLINGEFSRRDGIWGVPRSWNNNGWVIMHNPAYSASNGLPERLVVSGASLSTATLGGIITNTALRGTEFGPGGAPAQFKYGPLTSDPYTAGGDWQSNQVNNFNTLDQQITRKSVFTRASFDVTEHLQVFAQYSRSNSSTRSEQLKQFNVANIVISAGNPFIPGAVAQQMAAQNIPQFTLGTMNNDIPAIAFEGDRVVSRYVAGLQGKFSVLGKDWNWDAYYQKGVTDSSETGYNISYKDRFKSALDAVTDPATAAPICRITLTNPSSGCVPYNPMGLGVNSQAVLNYLLGSPHRDQQFTQDVAGATLRGEPFGLWAGPVSVALGVEHRREAVSGSADPNSLANNWFAGNYLPTFGSYRVTEGFAETVLPLLKNLPGAQSLEINAAARRTDYSTSGQVTTWKLGATWQPIDDIRFRSTRSRDIRAPNLNELFAAGTANTNNVLDPFNGNRNTAYQGKAVGNPELKPEVADQLGVGVVLTPQFLRGFSASVDYYAIKIRDAIGNVDAQTIVNNCFLGDQSYCSAISRGVGPGGTSVITQIRLLPFNLVEMRARGVDIEVSYRLNLASLVNSWAGGLTFRALTTHYLENYSNNGIPGNPPIDAVGSNGYVNSGSVSGTPHWVFNGSLSYTNEPLTLTLTARGISAGVNSTQNIQCTSGCPASTPTNPTINDNHLPGALYFDAYAAYRRTWNNTQFETYVAVTNLANRDPAVVAQGPGGLAYATPATNPTLYDVLGRTLRAGVRIAF